MKGWMELLQKKRKEEMFLLATKFRCGMLIQIDLRENPFVIFILFFKEKLGYIPLPLSWLFMEIRKSPFNSAKMRKRN